MEASNIEFVKLYYTE